MFIDIMERHMTEEERMPVCVALAFGEPEKIKRLFTRLFGDKQLTIEEVVRELKRVPELMKAQEVLH